MKVEWDEDSESRDINTRINHFAKKENIDLSELFKKLEKTHYKLIIALNRPYVLKNVRLNGILYKKLSFTSIKAYSKEHITPDCLRMTKHLKLAS